MPLENLKRILCPVVHILTGQSSFGGMRGVIESDSFRYLLLLPQVGKKYLFVSILEEFLDMARTLQSKTGTWHNAKTTVRIYIFVE